MDGNTKPKDIIIQTNKIYAINDNVSVSGKFFLGSGRIEGKVFYSYIIKNEEGFASKTISSDNVYLKYTNENYRIEEHSYKITNNWCYLFSVPLFMFKAEYHDFYIIYLPEDSITTDFEINLN